jgi:hypothetical protein
LKEQEEIGNVNAREFTTEFATLNAACINYVEMWEENFQETESFNEIN